MEDQYSIPNPVQFAEILSEDLGYTPYAATQTESFEVYLEAWAALMDMQIGGR